MSFHLMHFFGGFVGVFFKKYSEIYKKDCRNDSPAKNHLILLPYFFNFFKAEFTHSSTEVQ
mgnify:CR=1 FL=1